MMEAVLGPIPKSMAQASKGLHNCFTGRDFRLNWPADASKRSVRCGRACLSICYGYGYVLNIALGYVVNIALSVGLS